MTDTLWVIIRQILKLICAYLENRPRILWWIAAIFATFPFAVMAKAAQVM